MARLGLKSDQMKLPQLYVLLFANLICLASTVISVENEPEITNNKEIDNLVWFNDLIPSASRLQTFSVQRDDESTDLIEGTYIELSEGHLSDEESELWQNLLTKSDLLPINVNTILRKIQEQHIGQDYSFNGLNSNDIRTLIGIKDYRLSNCSPENVMKRKGLLKRPEFQNHQSLKNYINHYVYGQMSLCMLAFELMINSNINQLYLHTRKNLNVLLDSMRVTAPNRKFAFDVSDNSNELIQGVAKYLLAYPKTEQDIMEKVENGYMWPSQLRSIMNGHLRVPCSFLERRIGDFIDYFDLTHPRGDPDREYVNLSTFSLDWMATARICRAIYVHDDLYHTLNRHICRKFGITLASFRSDRILGPTPKRWLNEKSIGETQNTASEMIDIEQDKEKDKEKRSDDPFTVHSKAMVSLTYSPIAYELRKEQTSGEPIQEDPLESLFEDKKGWPLTEEVEKEELRAALGRTYKKYESQSSSSTSNSTREILGALKRGSMKLIYCSPDSMLAFWRLLNEVRVSKSDKLFDFVSNIFDQYENLCWSLFGSWLLMGVEDLHKDTQEIMNKIKLDQLIDLNGETKLDIYKDPVYDSIAQLIWSTDIAQKSVNLEESLSVNGLRRIINDIFDKHCFYVAEAVDGSIGYYTFLLSNEPKYSIRLDKKLLLWLGNGLICRALKDDKFISKIHEIIEPWQRSFQENVAIKPLTNDGLTFAYPIEPFKFKDGGLAEANGEQEREIRAVRSFAMILDDQRSKPKETQKALDKIRKLRTDVNFEVESVHSSDIDLLLFLRKFKIVDCLIDKVKERRNLVSRMNIKHKKLSEFVDKYNLMHEKVCWNQFDFMVYETEKTISEQVLESMRELRGELREHYKTPKLAYGLPEGDNLNKVIKAASHFVFNNAYFREKLEIFRNGYNNNNGEEKEKVEGKLPVLSPRTVSDLIDRTIGKICFRVNESFGDFVDYFDELSGPDGPFGVPLAVGTEMNPNIKFVMQKTTKEWMINVRMCRAICCDTRFFRHIYDTVVRLGNFAKSNRPESLPIIRRTHKYWLEYSSPEDSLEKRACTYDKSPNYVFTDIDKGIDDLRQGAMSQIDKAVFEGYWDKLNTQDDIEPHDLHHIAKILFLQLRKNPDWKLPIDDKILGQTQALKILRLIKCSPENMIRMKKLTDRLPRIIKTESVRRFVEVYKNAQLNICWRYFRLMAESNMDNVNVNLMTEFYDLVSKINPDSSTMMVDPEKLKLTMIKFIVKRADSTNYQNKKPKNESQAITMIKDLIEESCQLINESLGDFVDYVNLMLANDVKVTSMESYKYVWFNYVQFCRSLMGDRSFKHEFIQDFLRSQRESG